MRDSELVGLAKALAKDSKMDVTITGNTSYIDPKNNLINIARMPATPKGKMLMAGLIFHEVGHKHYTKGQKPKGLLGDLTNIIEDIRSEMLTVKDRPGTRFNLDAVTEHYVEKGSLDPQGLNNAICGKIMAYGRGKLLNQPSILAIEPKCDEIMEDAFSMSFIKELQKIIDKIPDLTSDAEAVTMAKKVHKLVLHEKDKQQQQQQQQALSKAQGKPQQGNGKSSGSGTAGGGGAGGSDVAEEEEDASAQHKQPSNPVDFDELLDEETGFGDLSKLIQQELNDESQNMSTDDMLKTPCLPAVGRHKTGREKLDEVHAVSAASRMRAKMIGTLQSIKRQPESYGKTGKKLAANKLARINLDPKIFKKKIEVKDINTAIVIAMDRSGSMGNMMNLACQASYAIHHALYSIPGVKVCSISYDKGTYTESINMMADFGCKPMSSNFNMRAGGGTPTDEAVWSARAMLLHRPEPRKILMVITDGSPDSKKSTDFATARAIKDGIEMAAIGIGTSCVKRFCKNSKCIADISELPPAMFSIMEGLLTKQAA